MLSPMTAPIMNPTAAPTGPPTAAPATVPVSIPLPTSLVIGSRAFVCDVVPACAAPQLNVIAIAVTNVLLIMVVLLQIAPVFVTRVANHSLGAISLSNTDWISRAEWRGAERLWRIVAALRKEIKAGRLAAKNAKKSMAMLGKGTFFYFEAESLHALELFYWSRSQELDA
jgi:hypothetical protein